MRSGCSTASRQLRRARLAAGARFGIVLACAALAVAAVFATASACRKQAAINPEVKRAVDTYFNAFKSEDATKVFTVVSAELAQRMPRLPEVMKKRLREANERYGGLEAWGIKQADVDLANGQALVTVQTTSKKAIHVVSLDLRMEEGSWKVYGIEQKDIIRNPDFKQQAPGDIGRPNPFDIR